MARIKYPVDFLNRTQLFLNIKKKHDNDGGGSPLISFLNQQHIDLAADATATNTAVEKHKLFEENAKAAEDATEARNNLFNPVFGRLRGSVHYLKGFYKGNEKELGLWGVQVVGRRIVYPVDFLQRTKLFEIFKARHDALGAASPLTPYLSQHNIDMAADGAATHQAETRHAQMEQAWKVAEELRESRDNLFNPVFANMRSIGQYLKGLYVNNPKELGHWGYTVDDSPPLPRRRKRTVKAGGQKTVNHVKTTQPFINAGTVSLLLYAGSNVQGEGVEVLPGGRTELTEEHNILTVANTNNGERGTFSIVAR